MANIPIRDIPGATQTAPSPNALLPMDNGTTMEKTTVQAIVDSGAPVASKSEAEAGTDNTKRTACRRLSPACYSRDSGLLRSLSRRPLQATGASAADGVAAGLAIGGEHSPAVATRRWCGREASSCPAEGAFSNITYRLNGSENWPSDVVRLLTGAMDEALYYYNCYADLSHELTVNYNDSVQTAEGSAGHHAR